MAKVVQVEIVSGDTHTVIWVDANLKPAEGMTLVCKGDKRTWAVAHAYTRTSIEMDTINSGWKVGGL